MLITWMGNPVYAACDWMVKLAYLNFLWVLFTAAGGVLLGLFPASAALSHCLRRLVAGETLNDVMPTFWNVYRSSFRRANVYGLFFWAGAAIITLNTMLVFQLNGPAVPLLLAGMIICAVLLLIVLLFFFPAQEVLSEKRFSISLQAALFVPFSKPLLFVKAAGGTAALLTLFFFVPGLLTFWGISSFALLAVYIMHSRLAAPAAA
ncbi:YesL family protein [Bacillus daqingensis]|uniref:YesL family protein n=1 Tax=Bacillus daqingensis TaxID=872396 RepID=A0ABV9NRM3_9BACI